MSRQAECGCDRPHHAHGRCVLCYKREVWRPRRMPGVRNEDNARLMRRSGIRIGQQPRKYAKCPSCQRFKSRPSSRCDYCGDEPGTYNGDPHEYDRANGWD